MIRYWLFFQRFLQLVVGWTPYGVTAFINSTGWSVRSFGTICISSLIKSFETWPTFGLFHAHYNICILSSAYAVIRWEIKSRIQKTISDTRLFSTFRLGYLQLRQRGSQADAENLTAFVKINFKSLEVKISISVTRYVTSMVWHTDDNGDEL